MDPFVASLNHELRAPLSNIISIANCLSDSPLNTDQQRYVQNIILSAEMLLTLVNDVLDISKAEAGKLEIESIPFHLGTMLEKIVSPIKLTAATKNLPIEVILDPQLPQDVIGDPLRLQQILVNLLSNAVKFTSSGQVTISVAAQSSLYRFEISDTGIGIDPENITKIFEEYAQGESSITRTYGGTGLGLSLCKKLVTLMGGHIGVKSTRHQGSTFWFDLPLATHKSTSLDSRQLKILLAEDNAISQEILCKLLEKMGDQVTPVNNGAEAVAQCQIGDFDLVLMDINMPVMDGLLATQAIRQLANGKDIPIIAVTANNFEEDRQKYLQVGMTDVLVKPVKRESLETLLAHYRHEDTLIDHSYLNTLITDLTKERVAELLQTYQKEAAQLIARLNPTNHQQGHEIAHTLAGLSENLGGRAVGQAARALIQAYRAQSPEIPELLQTLERTSSATGKAYERVIMTLKTP